MKNPGKVHGWPYEFIADNIVERPRDKDDIRDGTHNYIHRTVALQLADEITRLKEKIQMVQNSIIRLSGDLKK